MRYVSKDKTVQITGANRRGDAIGPISFDKGSYTTTDDDEVALLDQLVEDPNHPVGADPKDKEDK